MISAVYSSSDKLFVTYNQKGEQFTVQIADNKVGEPVKIEAKEFKNELIARDMIEGVNYLINCNYVEGKLEGPNVSIAQF